MTQEDLYETIRGDLTRAVAAVCPYWLADRRDDIIQNAMIRVLKIQSKGEETPRFIPSYLRRVAFTSLIDEIRRLRAAREEPLDGVDPPDGMDPEKECGGREIGVAIRGCLRGLVQPRRLAVTLYLHGHNVPEAARLLGWGRKKVENLVYRGLADLRGCLKSKGFEP